MRVLILGGAVALASVATVLAADQMAPPPGDYRIDAETTTTVPAGPMVMKTVQRVDGATGNTSVEQIAPDGTVTRQAYPGQGPNHWCVKGPSAPPPRAVACANRSVAALPGGGFSQEAVCGGGQRIADAFRKLPDGRWERSFQANRVIPSAAPVDPRTQAAMAPVIAQIEAQIRSGPPAEAEAAKQQLAALKASLGGGALPDGDTTITTREIWTKVSDGCG